MIRRHLVRIGALGRVGRFTAVDAVRYPRHARVIVRTSRGLETGVVLAQDDLDGAPADGSILRGMTAQDELLEARLERNKQAAIRACTRRLAEMNLSATLMDVEHLFDGQTLFFYFLGEVTSQLESLAQELAEVYEGQVQIRKFAETLTTGCGPNCGTAEASGQGCTSCASGCAVAGYCAPQAGRAMRESA